MALILNIETSTTICSVNIARKGEVIAMRETKEDKSHAAKTTIYIDEMLKELNIEIKNIDAVAVSKGPGSYTGLRIGVSTAKGICYGGSKPLIAVSTLRALALQISNQKKNNAEIPDNAWFCPMIDARRMEVYTAMYDSNNVIQKPISAEIITKNSFIEELNNRQIYFFGNGASKCKETINHKNAHFIDDIENSSISMAAISYQSFLDKKFEDVAYFEPFYLKDFIATTPKKNILFTPNK